MRGKIPISKYLIVSIIILAVGIPTAYAQTTLFGEAINLSNSVVDSIIPSKPVISGDNLFVVWDERKDPRDIFFARSIDGGNTYQSTINVSDSPNFVREPRITSSGNFVYVTWQEIIGLLQQIFFARSTDNGQTFSTPINLSNTPFSAFMRPKIAAVEDFVYVVWNDETTGSIKTVTFSRSTDNGLTFSSPVDIRTGVDSFPDIRISASGSNVYLVWKESSVIYFARSTDNGVQFDAPINLSISATTPDEPRLLVSGGKVYVVWSEGGTKDVFFVKSTDSGATFSSPINLSNSADDFSVIPIIAAFGNNIYVVWIELGTANSPFFVKSSNNGQSFSSPINLHNNIDSVFQHQIIASGNNVFVTWTQGSPLDVFFISSSDNGVTFSSPVNLSNNAGASQRQQILNSGSDVFVFWSDSTSGQFEVLSIKGVVTCLPPPSIDWTVSSTCTITGDATADGNVIVPSGVVLTIQNNVTFDINFATKNLTVESGGGVLIEAGGTIT